jgi:MoaA/NifB/PqqE/SkfB family radical SAM enzyme
MDKNAKRLRSAKMRNIALKYLSGRLRCAEFAVTNACVAKCSFCNIWKQQPKVFVDKGKALAAIDRLADFGVAHICFTGGEALLHPNIIDFVERASRRRMNIAMLLADPRLLTRRDMTKRLETAGCDTISISFDSDDPEKMSESRQILGIMDEMGRAMETVKRTSMRSMASVLIWNDNHDRMEAVCRKALCMGFDFIALNYPTFSDSDVYELGGEGISLSKEAVAVALEDCIRLKREKGIPFLNLAGSMQNIADYLRDPILSSYACHGGRRVLFLDWFFRLHPCMQLPYALGSGDVFAVRDRDLETPPCNRCGMSWYRDLSAFFCGVKSLPLIRDALRSGMGYMSGAGRNSGTI